MWSIGIYTGASAFELVSHPGATNPVLTSASVTDVPAKFVADPFMIHVQGLWYMFFEVLNKQTNKGEIGLATSSNALGWVYQQIVLSEQFHLSYPYVFEWNGDHYMIPETLEAGGVWLYRADVFPTDWSRLGALTRETCADPSVFRFRDQWWMFACSTPYQHDTLRLYFADELMGPWTEHALSPIVAGDKSKARPGGRVLVFEDRVVRFAQDCVPRYGAQLRAFEILELTASTFRERETRNSPVLTANGPGWNGLGMHHIDAHPVPEEQWIACVDGFSG